ncbi:MAG: MBL fold metallo-hydrolase [Ignavibacterium sp.]|nr:MBL fold metallo-hydrolase [Ignavibacterium sp.]
MAKVFNLGKLEITHLGHASFKIKIPPSEAIGLEFVIYFDPYQVRSGEKADLILITHRHHDHYDEKSIEVLRKKETRVLIGGTDIKENEEKQISGFAVKAVPAYNLIKPFHPRGKGVGFVLQIDGERIYYAGDTDKIPEMSELGKIDLAFLPIGGTYTMNLQEAVETVEIIDPKIVIPMHYNTFSEIKASPEEFKNLVGRKAEVVILE